LRVLSEIGESSLDDLLPQVYDDIDPVLLKMAKLSLWAHLLKLEHEGRALKRIAEHWAFGEERWVLAE